MNCKTCGGEARPLYDKYKGERYIVMWWCDGCDEEMFPEDERKTGREGDGAKKKWRIKNECNR